MRTLALVVLLLSLASCVAAQEPTLSADVVDLIENGQIEARVSGQSIQQVRLSLRRLVPETVRVVVPVGTFFVAHNTSSQSMVGTTALAMVLDDDDWVTRSISAACANRPRNIPGGSDKFDIRRSGGEEELAAVVRAVDDAGASYGVKQAAVWIITDDASWAEMGVLQLRRGGGPTRRVIGYGDAAHAMKLCYEAGVDITKKKIWHEAVRIFQEVEDAELKHWFATMERT